MRPSITSSPSRAAKQLLCAACRKDAASRAASTTTARNFSVAARAVGSRQTRVAASAPASSIPGQRWLSQSPRTLAPPSSSTAAASQSQQDSQPQQRIPTYYALFPETLPSGPPPNGPFEIDVRALRREFLRLQAAAHPDFHHSASSSSSSSGHSAERRRAEATSALINSAYKTLSSPLSRAQYLLHEIYGVDLVGDEAGSHGTADPELLMTVLEAREAVEEAQQELDLEPLRAENEGRIKDAEEALARAFKEGDLETAKSEAVRLRYWMNIRESVDNWERGKPVVLQH
ncbi:HSCB C-terminal oligomerization domain-containing protein [Diplogelasinospora grovesii]|uniref:HSCB C-terminal oligomerization domain-containing protein n=1 Tax=Diplogelasinospora grovesii TaxID=303347 RepID=A0AAN6N2N8_9PEZI|nr:HSCB C-terminal oligomerization domain-containing protein [Diplogelasinospora grovesii]